jgi:hypothetical protein
MAEARCGRVAREQLPPPPFILVVASSTQINKQRTMTNRNGGASTFVDHNNLQLKKQQLFIKHYLLLTLPSPEDQLVQQSF